MKIVVNNCRGSWRLSDEARELLGVAENDVAERWNADREKLVDLLEKKGSDFVSGEGAKLSIVEIPDAASDYVVENVDGGIERVIYAIDGKIQFALPAYSAIRSRG